MAKFKINGKKITGTKKKDKISWQKSWKKNLTVDALAGNDTIDFTKSTKNNTFIGGKGKDIIKTGKKTSTIVINKGDGNDTIYINGTKITIKFNKPNKKDKITSSEKKGNDLIITYTHAKVKGDKKAVSEKITFKNYFKENGSIVNDNIFIKNKKTAKVSALINNIKITPEKGVYRGSIKNDSITGTGANETIFGNGGNDTIKPGAGNDVINGGAGDDVIYLSSGNNKIIYDKNSGNDVIYDSTNKDTLVLSNISYAIDKPAIRKSGNDLIVFQNESDRKNGITFKNYFTQNASTRLNQIYYENGNQTVTIPSDLSDIKNVIIGSGKNVRGTSADDEIIVTAGNSTVYSSAGDDVINFGKTGKNTFAVDYSSATNSTLNGLTGSDTITANNVDIYAYSELVLDVGENKYVYIPDYLDNEAVLDTKIKLTSTNYIAPLRTYLTNMGYDFVSGNVILDSSDDKVLAIGPATITGAAFGSGAEIRTGSGNDVVNISNGINKIGTGDGDDTINVYGGSSNDIMPGYGHNTVNVFGGNNNTLSLVGEDEVYIKGGSNLIYTYGSGEVYLNGGSSSIYLNKDTYLGIYDGNNDIILTDDAMSLFVNGGINDIQGSDGIDTIHLLGGVNSISGGMGNDIINGNPNGGSYFYYEDGDGWDTVYTGHGENIKADTFKIYANLSDLSMQFDGNDALLWYNESEYVRVKDFLDSEYDDIIHTNPSNIWVEDSSGKRCRLSDLYINYPEYSYGTIYSDSINGDDYNNTLYGGWGNDTIRASAGNDTMYGGEGHNKYEFYDAYGTSSSNPSITHIQTISGNDTIWLYNCDSVSFEGSDSDLVIKYSLNGKYTNIILDRWFENPVDFKFDDNISPKVSVYNKISHLIVSGLAIGTENDDTIDGSGLIIGRGGNDLINTTSASIIFGGAGGDELGGSNGDDLIYSNYATVVNGYRYGDYESNVLWGGEGNDTLAAYGEDARLIGESGNDMYLATLSNNVRIYDYRGNNTLNIKKPDGEPEERAYLVFDVNTSGELVDSERMFVLNKSSYDYWLSHGSFENAHGEFGGIMLHSGYESLNPEVKTQAVNFIYDSSENSIDQYKRYTLAQEVANWLSGTGRTSVGDVIVNGTEQQKSDLIAMFNNFNDTQWTQAAG